MPLDQKHEFERSMMSFGDHLEELRRRLIFALIVPLPLMIALFPFADEIRGILTRPVFDALRSAGLPAQLQAMNPAETLATDLKLSIIFSLVLSGPWILWQGWKFIEPGLYNQERRFVHLLVPGSTLLTFAGLALLYFGMLPLMLRVLIAFGLPPDQPVYPIQDEQNSAMKEDVPAGSELEIPIRTTTPKNLSPGMVWLSPGEDALHVAVPMGEGSNTVRILNIAMIPEGMVLQQYRLREYINFILILMVGIAIAFQMPLVILLLGWVGIIGTTLLEQNRRYALLGCGVVSAIITPADIVSMILMLVPLYALYELGIILLKLAPADRVAQGNVFKGAVEDVLGRFQSQKEDDNDDDDDDDDPPTAPSDTDPEPSTPPRGTLPRTQVDEPDVPDSADDRDGDEDRTR
jgi:sec-independent protein translocase protein TatC